MGILAQHQKWRVFESPQDKLEFDLHMALDHNADWFTGHLFRLIAKADARNRERLRLAYPHAVQVFEDWRANQLRYHHHDERL
jgi:hypothetical protein